jgi:hypothetical protein
METRAFHVSYWDTEYLDSQFPERRGTANNTPYFQLSEGNASSPERNAIVRAANFEVLTLDLFYHLKKPESLNGTYKMEFNEDATKHLNREEKKILEEILAMHNDLVTPRRS